ncbi:hypothetical protein [Nocardia cyriacigeorgica]|uniref:hypothetical protein n=1 Tax=Nocardia cyriacigeorgica TaxID=135487 RepID=UPI003F683E59
MENRLRYLARRLGLRVCVLFNSDMGIRRILALAGIAVTELPGEYAQPGRVRRIGYVEDHQAMAVGLAAVLSEQPDLSVVAMAPTVGELLAQSTDLDLAILDLRWAARARGVKVALDDSGGLERADGTVRQSVRTVVGDALDYAEAGAVTVRTLPPGRSNLVAILAGSATAWTGDGGGADRARGEHAVGDYVR